VKKRICFVVAAEITVKSFLVEHIRRMSPHFVINVVVNTHDKDLIKPYGIDIPVIPIFIERKISPLADIKALFELYRLFRRERYDVVHSVTPKAGLLAMVAGFFANIPVRIHMFTGQVWVTKKGLKKYLLKIMDEILSLCATNILVDSPSQRDFIVKEGIVSATKAEVIGDGSICGVDAKRFLPNTNIREEIRKSLSIAESDIVFLYLGRLNRDKGLLILAESFSKISSDFPNAHLFIAGPDEEGIQEDMLLSCKHCSEKIHFFGYTENPEQLIAAVDIFCLPSYREGFGLVIIEAASAAVPSIASRIYGLTDTIDDGLTGLLFAPGNADELSQKMLFYLKNVPRIREMGLAARERSLRLYSQERVTGEMLEYYRKITEM
jgi:glycosyltransferase involved in cell wall biosynthesis